MNKIQEVKLKADILLTNSDLSLKILVYFYDITLTFLYSVYKIVEIWAFPQDEPNLRSAIYVF